MLEVIEKLLILQDRDRKILKAEAEVATVGPQRQALNEKLAATQAGLMEVQHRVKELETQRKELELEVESHLEHINKYSTQQMLTKKNEEYQALAREIHGCKMAISKLEDQQLELMEKIESGQARVKEFTKIATELKSDVEKEIAELDEREQFQTATLKELQGTRNELAEAVESTVLTRYERILAKKGDRVIVGVEHGVCGGCHMRLPAQEIVACQRQQEIISCPNCGRILYYTRDMILTEKE